MSIDWLAPPFTLFHLRLSGQLRRIVRPIRALMLRATDGRSPASVPSDIDVELLRAGVEAIHESAELELRGRGLLVQAAADLSVPTPRTCAVLDAFASAVEGDLARLEMLLEIADHVPDLAASDCDRIQRAAGALARRMQVYLADADADGAEVAQAVGIADRIERARGQGITDEEADQQRFSRWS